MANDSNEKEGPDDTDHFDPHKGGGMDAEARAYLNEMRADEDAARNDWADDGECINLECLDRGISN